MLTPGAGTSSRKRGSVTVVVHTWVSWADISPPPLFVFSALFLLTPLPAVHRRLRPGPERPRHLTSSSIPRHGPRAKEGGPRPVPTYREAARASVLQLGGKRRTPSLALSFRACSRPRPFPHACITVVHTSLSFLPSPSSLRVSRQPHRALGPHGLHWPASGSTRYLHYHCVVLCCGPRWCPPRKGAATSMAAPAYWACRPPPSRTGIHALTSMSRPPLARLSHTPSSQPVHPRPACTTRPISTSLLSSPPPGVPIRIGDLSVRGPDARLYHSHAYQQFFWSQPSFCILRRFPKLLHWEPL
jgi:hypothetical protein